MKLAGVAAHEGSLHMICEALFSVLWNAMSWPQNNSPATATVQTSNANTVDILCTRSLKIKI